MALSLADLFSNPSQGEDLRTDIIRQTLSQLRDKGIIDDSTLDTLLSEGFERVEPVFGAPPGVQGFAPRGPNLNFLGGSPFEIDERPAIARNAFLLTQRLLEAAAAIRKKQAENKAQQGQQGAQAPAQQQQAPGPGIGPSPAIQRGSTVT